VLTPFLVVVVEEHLLEYTGGIGISGRNQGTILFSALPSLFMMLMTRYREADTRAPGILLDLVGEIANSIGGNVWEVFGSKFQLSPPVALRAPIQDLVVAKGLQSYCIPIDWRVRRAHLIVSLS
jgi:chemotaxis protein CheX